jgi:hypothetical protein
MKIEGILVILVSMVLVGMFIVALGVVTLRPNSGSVATVLIAVGHQHAGGDYGGDGLPDQRVVRH